MESEKRPRRKQRKPKVENYYKMLGLRANAAQQSIKQKYIELVKAYPPETHPEEFQQIRRAYEVLRDPQKRSEYDLMRKYGNQIEAVLEEAMEKMENEQWAKAADLFRKALQISPRNLSAGIGLAHAAFIQGDEETFQQQFRLSFEAASTEGEKIIVAGWQAKLLMDADRAEEALEVLDRASSLYPEQAYKLNHQYLHSYLMLGRAEQAWACALSALPAVETQEPDDIRLFIDYINTMMELKKWNVWSQVQSKVKKFLKTIETEEDKLMVVSLLMHEYSGFYEVGRFREAEIYIDFAYYTDPRHPVIQDLRREVQRMSRIEREIDRLFLDMTIFPLVTFQAYEWFYEGFVEEDNLSYIKSMVPPSLLAEMEHMNEEHAAGIVRLKKKYPLVYREFQEHWDEMYEGFVAGFNREARRRLK